MGRIRAAGELDVDAVWPLVSEFATTFRPVRESFEKAFAELITRDDTLVLVATDDGQIVGYLLASTHGTFFANAPVAWVEEVMVAESARRSGVATALMAHAELWARQQGAAYVSLATRRAANFYDALGYEESATFFRKLLT
jgi:GNAT superfamily N-acetyltransferase